MKASALFDVLLPEDQIETREAPNVSVSGTENAIQGIKEIVRENLRITIEGNHNRIIVGENLACGPNTKWLVRGDHNTIMIGQAFDNQSNQDWQVIGDHNNIVLEENVYFFAVGLLRIWGNRNLVRFGRNVMAGPNLHLVSDDSKFTVGDDTTMFRCQFRMHEKSRVAIGRDCMLSFGITMSSSDMHPIYDMVTDERINLPGDIEVGDHVWIGLGATILKGVRIGSGSVIGARTIVTKDVGTNVAVAGEPARIIRENVYWDRKLPQPDEHADVRARYEVRSDSRVLVCSAAVGAEFQERAAPCLESHRNYCLTNQYQYRIETNRVVEDRPIPWTKVRFLRRLLSNCQHEVIVWVDADAMITNNHLRVEDWIDELGDRDLLLTRDANGAINTGVMIMKNTPWVRRFFKQVDEKEDFAHHPWREQGAIIDLYRSDADVRDHCRLTDADRSSLVHAYAFNFEPASWLVHFAGHKNFATLAALYAPYANRSTAVDPGRRGVYFQENVDYERPKGPDEDRRARRFEIHNADSNAFLKETETIIRSNGCDCSVCRKFLIQMKNASEHET